MRQNGMRDMTAGSPAGHILYFALPLLAGSLLQQFYNMVDSWVGGRYVWDGALAGVCVGFPVLSIFA
ncbi:MAG: MATE family efflux transporter, partial [Dysosmobacter sp.]|nr:MATE family efflux transporter [Dysosmobacter sp.]